MSKKTCAICTAEKPIEAFEKGRKQCKACRKAKKTESIKAGEMRDPATAPHVERCRLCDALWSAETFRWRTDVKGGAWRTDCNACFGSKGYHTVHRAKKRAEDEAGFLSRNAAAMKRYRDDHPEYMQAVYAERRADPNARWNQLVSSSRARGKEVCVEDKTALQAMMLESCFYCGYVAPEGERINGLDRADASDPRYAISTAVPCCAICNQMKSSQSIDAFVLLIRRVRTPEIDDAPPTTIPRALGGHGNSVKPDKTDHLPPQHRAMLLAAACVYCGIVPALGIDRVDPALAYTMTNSAACCSGCNYAKKNLEVTAFLRHAAHIQRHTRAWVLRPAAPMTSPGKTAAACYTATVAGVETLRLLRLSGVAGAQEHPATDFDTLFHRIFRNS